MSRIVTEVLAQTEYVPETNRRITAVDANFEYYLDVTTKRVTNMVVMVEYTIPPIPNILVRIQSMQKASLW